MASQEIILKYNRKDFEEIYFRNGGGNIFLHPNLKKEFYTLVAIGIILTGLFIYYMLSGEERTFLVIVSIIFCLLSIDFYRKAEPTITWKRQIKTYLNGLDKIKENKIVISPNSFSLIQDQRETIEKWSEFKKVEINDTHILISSSTNYIIPKKSMTSNEFDFLKKVISEKIKNEG